MMVQCINSVGKDEYEEEDNLVDEGGGDKHSVHSMVFFFKNLY
jgi:hypothetical protein